MVSVCIVFFCQSVCLSVCLSVCWVNKRVHSIGNEVMFVFVVGWLCVVLTASTFGLGVFEF